MDQQKTPEVKSKVNDQQWDDIDDKVHEFKDRNSWLYVGGSGLRNKAVHLEVVEGDKEEKGPIGTWGSGTWGTSTFGGGNSFEELHLKDHKLSNGKSGPVIPAFEKHLKDLEDFVTECEKIKSR